MRTVPSPHSEASLDRPQQNDTHSMARLVGFHDVTQPFLVSHLGRDFMFGPKTLVPEFPQLSGPFLTRSAPLVWTVARCGLGRPHLPPSPASFYLCVLPTLWACLTLVTALANSAAQETHDLVSSEVGPERPQSVSTTVSRDRSAFSLPRDCPGGAAEAWPPPPPLVASVLTPVELFGQQRARAVTLHICPSTLSPRIQKMVSQRALRCYGARAV